MRALTVSGIVLAGIGVIAMRYLLHSLQIVRQPGIGAIAGGILPLELLGILLGIVGVVLLISAAIIKIAPR